MTAPPLVAINPLPWFLSTDGEWQLSTETIEAAAEWVTKGGFGAISIDIPAEMPVAEYANLLADLGLGSAPGYLGADFHDTAALPDLLERTRQHAAAHRALGIDHTFIASNLSPERIARPAVGAFFDRARFDALILGVTSVANVLLEDGITPCVHPHVGSWIETEAEVDELMAAVSQLSFGPDTGHLFWAGMDPAAVISRYRDRVRAIHLKDASRAAAEAAREGMLDYFGAARSGVWRELGEGDVDLVAVLNLLGTDFDGWHVVEVDVPHLPTAAESTVHSGSWVRARLGGVA
jgi:inosose dehydratase